MRSSSTYFRCQNSSNACTVGISSKLCTGGGEVVIHSSVRASHGSATSAAAGLGFAYVVTRFTMKTRIDRAIKNAPTVATWFHIVRPSESGYV